MSKKRKNRPQSSKTNHRSGPTGQDNSGLDSKSDHMEMMGDQTPAQMETFPKPNTFPKNWDFSGILKS